MKHRIRSSVLQATAIFAAALCLFSAQTAPAQVRFDELSTHYRFLPRHSVLNETGGIYQRDVDFRVFGTFDFVRQPGPTDVWPPQYEFRFDEVEAWASHPILAYVLPLNQVLNLEGLTGRQLPVDGPFDMFKFEGKTQDGSQVDLFATRLGPWLRLRGGTTPPPGSADFFVYNLSALARQTPFADFDENDAVDAGDLTKWTSGFGSTPPGGNATPYGDSNGDDVVDGADFLTWQQQLGEAEPPIAALDAAMDAAIASLNANVAAVPEPGAWAIIIIAMAFVVVARRR